MFLWEFFFMHRAIPVAVLSDDDAPDTCTGTSRSPHTIIEVC